MRFYDASLGEIEDENNSDLRLGFFRRVIPWNCLLHRDILEFIFTSGKTIEL